MRRRFKLFIVAAATTLTGCATAGPNTTPTRSDVITAAQISTSGASSAWDAVQRLQPHWLRPPATGSIAGGVAQSQVILVYLDGHRLGDVSSLRTLSTSGITSMRWLDAARASTVLTDIGSDPIAGAIVIRTQ